MALHATLELGAVAQWCIVGKGLRELHKLPKVFHLQPKAASKPSQETEEGDLILGNLTVECFLSLLLEVIIILVGLFGLQG